MFRFGKTIVILFLVALLIGVAGFYSWRYMPMQGNDSFNVVQGEWDKTGNSAANLANGGFVAQNGPIIAVSSLAGMKLVYVNENMPTVEEVTGDVAWDLNVTQNGIFYINVTDGSRIYRMDLDGSNQRPLNDTHSRHLVVSENKIYYADNRDDNKVYSMDLDGSNREQVMDNPAIWLVIEDDWIYYAHDMENYHLHKYNLKTGEDVKLTEHAAWRIVPHGQYVYYIMGMEGGSIYRVPKEGSASELVVGARTENFMVKDNDVYYSDMDGTYLYNLETGHNAIIMNRGYMGIYDAKEYLLLLDNWTGELLQLNGDTGQVESMLP
jgi:outer membrane protein assembly factor BamB